MRDAGRPEQLASSRRLAATRWLMRACSRLLRSEEHTSELQSPCNLVCRLLLEKKKPPPPRLRCCPRYKLVMPLRPTPRSTSRPRRSSSCSRPSRCAATASSAAETASRTQKHCTQAEAANGRPCPSHSAMTVPQPLYGHPIFEHAPAAATVDYNTGNAAESWRSNQCHPFLFFF